MSECIITRENVFNIIRIDKKCEFIIYSVPITLFVSVLCTTRNILKILWSLIYIIFLPFFSKLTTGRQLLFFPIRRLSTHD